MPVSRRTAEGLSSEVAATYGRAEVRLLRLIAKHLDTGHGAPGWAEAKLAELQTFRKRAEKIVRAATVEAAGHSADAIATAYNRGQAAGEGELANAGRDTADLSPRRAEYAAEALTRAQHNTLEDLGPRVVRGAQDAYRDAVVRASGGTLTGATTRREDAQAALDELARKGITGFTDKAGRRWGLESYVDMATRTTTAQAAVQGHMDRLEDGGLSLFIVSTSSRECPDCAKWEGKVLSRGPVDAMATNVVTGKTERVRVDGTVEEATRAGLFHPNCTHNLSGYVHGATKRDHVEHDPKGYAEKQRQRAMERSLREWKRRQAVAVTPEAKAKAEAKVRGWQQAIRDHVEATGLPRKYARESFDVKAITVPGDLPAHGGPLESVDVELIDTEMADLMAADDYGSRFEQLASELDRRDTAGQVQTLVPSVPDAVAERAALDRLLFGDREVRDLTSREGARRRDPEAELRDEYDTWVHTQWLRAEAETRGVLLSRRAEHDGVDPLDLFTRKLRDLRKYASPELQEWFSRPGNQRMSFPEFRAGRVDDKKAREANMRRRNRGFESEFG